MLADGEDVGVGVFEPGDFGAMGSGLDAEGWFWERDRMNVPTGSGSALHNCRGVLNVERLASGLSAEGEAAARGGDGAKKKWREMISTLARASL